MSTYFNHTSDKSDKNAEKLHHKKEKKILYIVSKY